MLREIHLKNYGLFVDERIAFKPGMTVVTGETGAGKSLVVGAMALLMGARASQEEIRSGSDEAIIEGFFEITKPAQALLSTLLQAGFKLEEGTLTIRRVLQTAGRSRIFINDQSSTVNFLQLIAPYLLDLSGQHEQQVLLQSAHHLQLIDEFADHQDMLNNFRAAFKQCTILQQSLGELKVKQATAVERADFLSFRLKELAALNLKEGEEEELENRFRRMQNSQQLFELTQQSIALISDMDGSLIEQLGQVRQLLKRAASLDPSLNSNVEQFESSAVVLQELAQVQNNYLQSLDFDPRDSDQLQARLAKLSDVRRKYGTVALALEQLQSMQQELSSIGNLESDIQTTEAEWQNSRAELLTLGKRLSESRQRAATKLSKAIAAELKELAMPGASLSFQFSPLSEPSFNGLEDGEFYFTANPGEPLKAMNKVASGGELSRVLLAIKMVLLSETVGTLIFDEIDAGIGGRQAEVVGRKMASLAKQGRQVFCVTHLAPIAVYGDQHYTLSKAKRDERTLATVTVLNNALRKEEIARMLSGIKVSEKTLKAAEELLSQAHV